MENIIDPKKAVVIFSGGQDSTTLLFWARKQFETVIALSFDYGQRHRDELICASSICSEYGFPHEIMDLSLLNQLAPNALTRSDIEVPKEEAGSDLPSTFVDGRNMLFLSFASIFAKQKGIGNLVTGVSQSDFSGYPDCRDVFIKSMNVTLNLAMDFSFNIHTPLMWIDKMQTWAMADDLGVFDIIRDKTLTCYNGIIGAGCGECPACRLRAKGLAEFLKDSRSK